MGRLLFACKEDLPVCSEALPSTGKKLEAATSHILRCSVIGPCGNDIGSDAAVRLPDFHEPSWICRRNTAAPQCLAALALGPKTGSIGGHNLGDFCFSNFHSIFWGFWVLYYSKMAY